MLNQLQDDILELRPLNETRELWPAVDLERDTSIRFHIAHSAQREVEILHDQLLQRFSADPTLRPRDIIVMVPDTPQVESVLFGENGVAEGVGPNKVVIDMSSISPTATKAFAEKIKATGAAYLDAPVSGGEELLSDLNFMVPSNRYSSGDRLRYEKALLDRWFEKRFGRL
mgnify:CR=1 FL=1